VRGPRIWPRRVRAEVFAVTRGISDIVSMLTAGNRLQGRRESRTWLIPKSAGTQYGSASAKGNPAESCGGRLAITARSWQHHERGRGETHQTIAFTALSPRQRRARRIDATLSLRVKAGEKNAKRYGSGGWELRSSRKSASSAHWPLMSLYLRGRHAIEYMRGVRIQAPSSQSSQPSALPSP